MTSSAAARSMFERRRHALAAALVLLGVAYVLTVVVARDPGAPAVQGLDDRWLARMTDVRTPIATDVAGVMAALGGPYVLAPLRLLVAGALAWRRRWLQFGAFVGAIVTSELCIGPLKAVLDRPRPPDALIGTSSSSFPSGHAIAASVTAIGLVVVLVPAASRRTAWTVVAASFATVMAMSRTYLGAHWASDVIAGACIGTGLAVGWPAALELLRARRRQAGTGEHGDRAAGAISWSRGVAVALLAVGFACVLALHVLRADLGPAGHRMSEYAVGRYGWVMTVAFTAIGLGLLALAHGVARQGGRWSRRVAAALGVAGLATLGSGIWPTDPLDAVDDEMHSLASALATIALVAAAAMWSLARRPRRADAAAGLAAAAAGLAVLSPLLHHSSWTGLGQRLLWLALLGWSTVTALRLRSPCRARTPDDAPDAERTTTSARS